MGQSSKVLVTEEGTFDLASHKWDDDVFSDFLSRANFVNADQALEISRSLKEEIGKLQLHTITIPLLEKIISDFNQPPGFTGTLIGHHLKYIEGQRIPASPFDYNRIYELFDFIIRKKLKRNILKEMLPEVYEHPKMDFDSVLTTIQYQPASEEEILDNIPVLKEKFKGKDAFFDLNEKAIAAGVEYVKKTT